MQTEKPAFKVKKMDGRIKKETLKEKKQFKDRYEMSVLRKTVIGGCFLFLFSTALFSADANYETLYHDLPFAMNKVQAPVIPLAEISLADYGGVGDGITMNSSAFKKAIQALSEKGGGKLIVPPGIWLTGPIELKSNIDLRLEKGSVILFSTDFSLYVSPEGHCCQSLISGKNLENVAITGDGSINGSGQVWRPLKKSKVTDSKWKEVLKTGGALKEKDTWYPTKKLIQRPVMISFEECKKVMLQGVLFENSPGWNIHPLLCEDVIIDHIFSRNPSYAQNGDGLDVESCKNVLVVNSTFDVGDDGICIKSGKDAEGRKRARATENVIVDNCKVFQGHGGFVVGSEMSGSVRNISVRNCEFLGTDVGLRFKSNRGRGGVVENIYIDHIYMLNIVNESFLFDLYYGEKTAADISGETVPVTEETPCFRNIYVKNLVSYHARRAMFFNGLPEMNISNIHLENAIITSHVGAELVEADGVKFTNVSINPEQGAAFIFKNVKNFTATGLMYPQGLQQPFTVEGEKTKNIELPVSVKNKNLILYSEKVDPKEIRLQK